VVLPHLGFPDLAWAFDVAGRFPQVWLDLTNVPGSFAWMGVDQDDLRQTLVDGVARFRDRVLVGTDYPAGMGDLDQILAQFETCGFDDTLLEHVMVRSTCAFFDRYGRRRP
jgi:predicted TIM-barrel fold metal-dependent hydrolase